MKVTNKGEEPVSLNVRLQGGKISSVTIAPGKTSDEIDPAATRAFFEGVKSGALVTDAKAAAK